MLAACCWHQHGWQAHELLTPFGWIGCVQRWSGVNFINPVAYAIHFVALRFNPRSCDTCVALLFLFYLLELDGSYVFVLLWTTVISGCEQDYCCYEMLRVVVIVLCWTLLVRCVLWCAMCIAVFWSSVPVRVFDRNGYSAGIILASAALHGFALFLTTPSKEG